MFDKIKSELTDVKKRVKRVIATVKSSGGSDVGAKDTSGRLKKIHGRSRKKLAEKKRRSEWHQKFYKDAPKGRLKRTLWLMHPKRQFKFWFSKHGLKLTGKIAVFGLAAGLLFGLGIYGYYSRQLPGPEEIRNRLLSQSTQFYDRTGETLLYETFGDEDRTVVEWDEISDNLKDATVAVEDQNFYDHWGIDLTAITRAGIAYVVNRGEITQGGSTITQQFIKKSLLTDEQSFDRKIKEAILAVELERVYSKQEILQFYLNEAPYGGTSYGVQAAAENYFRTSAKDLTLDQAAVLAALPQRPTFFIKNLDQLEARKGFVLEQMVDQGFITQEQADKAKEKETTKDMRFDRDQYRGIKAPHFVLEARQLLEEKYGADTVAQGGLQVITTVDLELQKRAEQAIKDNISTVEAGGGNNASITSIDPGTGQILAMAGSRDFFYEGFGAFNVATARRQPGSSFKPYVYATLMQENYGAGSVFYDINGMNFGTSSNPYEPNNFDNSSRGPLSIRQALAESRNIPAVKANYIAGVDKVLDQVESMGVSIAGSRSNYGLSSALGAADIKQVDHVGGFGTFANDGVYQEKTYILKIENSQGEVIEEWQENKGERVLDEEVAYIIQDMLSDAEARRPTFGYLDYFIVPGVDFIVKTGSTNAQRDGVIMGSSTELALGVWVGHSDNNPMYSTTSRLAGPMFRQYARSSHDYIQNSDDYDSPGEFDRPSGVKTVTLDRYTGRVPVEGSSSTVTDIFPSWYKAPSSSDTDPFVIDTVSGLLATECTPEAARKEVRIGGIAPEIPPSDPAYARWNAALRSYLGNSSIGGDGIAVKPTQEDDVHKCNDRPPEITSLDYNESDRQVTVSAKKGTLNLDRLLIKLNGQVVSGGSFDVSGSSATRSVVINKSSGTYKITAEIIDKGLYSDTSSQDITISGSSDEDIEFDTPTTIGNTVNLSWSGGDKPYFVEICRDGGSCKSESSGNDNETFTSLDDGDYTWTVNGESGPPFEISTP